MSKNDDEEDRWPKAIGLIRARSEAKNFYARRNGRKRGKGV
jgi:hypothetical protein